MIHYENRTEEPVKSVDVMGIVFDVYLADQITSDGDLLHGLVRYKDGEITIARSNPYFQYIVLTHEIVHVIDEIQDIGLNETDVHRLGYGLFAVMSNNPDLFDIRDPEATDE